MAWHAATASWVAALAFAAAAAGADRGEVVQEALALDDVCSSVSASMQDECSLHALQRRGQRAKARDESGTKVDAAAEQQRRIVLQAWQAHEAEKLRLGRHPMLNAEPGDPGGLKVRIWHGGGLVDSLKGDEQVEIMQRRDEDWRIGRIIYQVFVDRFVPPECFKCQEEYLTPPRKLKNWSDPVTSGVQNLETKYYTTEIEFWGGTLKGVLSKLEYIHSLGDVLYLQPIFKAFSAHKYDTSDYYQIDPSYGTLADFTALVDAVHARKMHLVLDGVFNHIGIRSHLFREAFANPKSEYRDWFFIGEQYGKNGYKAWQGGGTLAELRLEETSLKDYLWLRNDSVVATWLKRGADGWRLDVGTEIGREFLWNLTNAAHTHKFGSLVVGEVSAYPRWWTEAMDGVLSFWMGWLIRGVVKREMGGVFVGMQIEQLIQESSMEQVLSSWIIVSNHDLPRLTSVYPDENQRRFARILQFVLPGSVCIYYGEELGMTGDGDPFNRAPMQWDNATDANADFNFSQALVKMRRGLRALRIGDFHSLRSFSLLAFARRTDRISEIVIVLANPLDKPLTELVAVPVEDILEYTLFRDVFTGDEVRFHGGTLQMEVPPQTARVLTMVEEKGPNSDQYKRIYGHWETFDGVDAVFSLGNSVGEIIPGGWPSK